MDMATNVERYCEGDQWDTPTKKLKLNKNAVPLNVTCTNDDDIQEISTVKRKRGRPRKRPLPNQEQIMNEM